MLSGTDLSQAYGLVEDSYGEVPSAIKQNVAKPSSVQAPPPQLQSQSTQNKAVMSPQNVASLDPSFLTADQKLHLLSSEFQKQREMFENSKSQNAGYLDKLILKKKDVAKLIVFSLVILLALSLHDVISTFVKNYLEDADLTPTKAWSLRLMYPVLVLFVLWNIKTFMK